MSRRFINIIVPIKLFELRPWVMRLFVWKTNYIIIVARKFLLLWQEIIVRYTTATLHLNLICIFWWKNRWRVIPYVPSLKHFKRNGTIFNITLSMLIYAVTNGPFHKNKMLYVVTFKIKYVHNCYRGLAMNASRMLIN